MAFAPGFLFYFSASSSVIFTSLKVGWCTSKPFFFYGLCDPWRRPSSSTMESQPSQHWTLLAPWPLLLAIKQWNHDDDDDKINLVIIYSWPKEKCLQQKSSGSIDLFHYLFFFLQIHDQCPVKYIDSVCLWLTVEMTTSWESTVGSLQLTSKWFFPTISENQWQLSQIIHAVSFWIFIHIATVIFSIFFHAQILSTRLLSLNKYTKWKTSIAC